MGAFTASGFAHAIPALVMACFLAVAARGQQPNIVLILVDEYGVGNIQAHYPDNEIATTHIDRFTAARRMVRRPG